MLVIYIAVNMNIAARTNLVGSLKFLTQPICASCIRQLLSPSSGIFISSHKAHQYTLNKNVLNEMSRWEKFKWEIGLTGKLKVSKQKLIVSGTKLYVCCSDFIDFSEFIKVVNLPDTFSSWFLLIHLHLWLVNVKISQMGKEGAILKEYLYRFMWRDVERRLETFQDLAGVEKRKSLENFYSSMVSSVIYYDEGLIGSDKVLANSLWMQLFNMQPDVQVDHLETMVEYVRKQAYHHDQLDPELIMKTGYISFLPLLGDKLNQQKAEQDFKKLTESF